ncbi:MAG: hypothetical protein FJY29_03505 [Betaproteobacteria bacterium]|nr:hypothetical protein [Betaproteobacteria bacterium]
MTLENVSAILEQALGVAQHHSYLLISRSFAADTTPVALTSLLLEKLAGVKLFENSAAVESERFWEAFGRHPDLVRAPAERSILRKEDVELFRERSLYPATLARRRFFLIERAERLNNQSANALLKTLEEPQAECVFVLMTSRPNALPPTVASRCQKILLPTWDVIKSAEEQLEREDLKFLEKLFDTVFSNSGAAVHFPPDSLTARMNPRLPAETLVEWTQWADQAGRRYAGSLLRDVLVEKTSAALRSGTLSRNRATGVFSQINAWADADPLNPTNSFWLMRILLTLVI